MQHSWFSTITLLFPPDRLVIATFRIRRNLLDRSTRSLIFHPAFYFSPQSGTYKSLVYSGYSPNPRYRRGSSRILYPGDRISRFEHRCMRIVILQQWFTEAHGTRVNCHFWPMVNTFVRLIFPPSVCRDTHIFDELCEIVERVCILTDILLPFFQISSFLVTESITLDIYWITWV